MNGQREERTGMKKITAIVALTLMTSAAAFALPDFNLSFGGGVIFDIGLGNGFKAGGTKSTQNFVGGGAFGFFDATFAELDFAFVSGGIKSSGQSNRSGTFGALDLSLLGKYPFPLGPITVFPLLGFDYQIIFSVKDIDGNKASNSSDYSSFGFNAGGGLDFSLSGPLYLRGEFLYALRLPSKIQKDGKDRTPDSKYILGHGPIIKIAVGYSL
jgi:opacity protein-like surface antigen